MEKTETRRVKVVGWRRFEPVDHREWIKPVETTGEPAGGTPALPTLGERARNFVKAGVEQVGGFVRTGKWYRTPEEAKAVYQICRTPNEEEKARGLTACQWYREDDRCGHPKCGCNLKHDALVSKTRWRSTRCAAGRWGKS